MIIQLERFCTTVSGARERETMWFNTDRFVRFRASDRGTTFLFVDEGGGQLVSHEVDYNPRHLAGDINGED